MCGVCEENEPTHMSKQNFICSVLLPTWSVIMIPFFGYGGATESSSTSESLFNELKNRGFQHKTLPIRLDEFVQEHINYYIIIIMCNKHE